MNMQGLLAIVLRSVWLNKKRYAFLVGGLALGAGVLVLLNSLFAAMIFNTEKKASVYYGGDATIIGFFRISSDQVHFTYGRAGITELDSFKSSIQNVMGDDTRISLRRVSRDSGVTVYNRVEGSSIRQRLLIGVDFDEEADLLSLLGVSVQGIRDLEGTSGIMISRVAAERLNVRMGDEVTMVTRTITGQKNSGRFVVGAIFNDSSVFGATTIYMDMGVLNRLLGDSIGFGDELVFHTTDRRINDHDLDRLQAELESKVDMFPRLKKKSDGWQDDILPQYKWNHTKYILISLAAHLSQVHDRILVLELVGAFLASILLVMVMIGVFNTFRLMVYERYREVGTLRALGMKKRQVIFMFLGEAALISVAGFIAGLFLYGMLDLLVRMMDFAALPGFEVFLENNRLVARLQVKDLLLAGIALVVSGMAGAFHPALKAATLPPADALRKE